MWVCVCEKEINEMEMENRKKKIKIFWWMCCNKCKLAIDRKLEWMFECPF